MPNNIISASAVGKKLEIISSVLGCSLYSHHCGQLLVRIFLPRILDSAFDTLDLLAIRKLSGTTVESAETKTELVVIDFTDAYWHIPVHPTERKFFTCKLRGAFFTFS